MKFIGSRWRVISILVAGAVCAVTACAAKRPQYGGSLRVEMHTAGVSLDPREWKPGLAEAAASEQLAALVFDRLVALDNYGRFQARLAVSWTHDADFRRWQFDLRTGVKFTDGALLTAADVIAALEPLLPVGRQVSSNGNAILFRSSSPMPDLLEDLSSGRFFILRPQAAGAPVGTGPFLLEKTETATDAAMEVKTTRFFFRANEECWAGRPFLDRVEVTIGLPPLRRLYDLQLGKADLIELAPDLVRRAAQDGLRTWASFPLELYALRFDDRQPVAEDTRLREALAASLDRSTMASVLLQKQAEPAGSFLPQWLSGYAFLFPRAYDPEGATRFRKEMPATLATAAQPVRLRVEAPGDVARLLGDRVAVNARQSGVILQVMNRSASRTGSTPEDGAAPALHLIRWHFDSLSARATLEAMAVSLAVAESQPPAIGETLAEELYARERRLIGDRRFIPLVSVPQFIGLSTAVRDWMPARWGEWHLDEAWLDAAGSAAPGTTGQDQPAGEKP